MSKYFFAFSFIFFSILGLKSQDSIQSMEDLSKSLIESDTIFKEQVEAIESIQTISISRPDYNPWNIVTLEGKLKMKGLPLSPSLKIFMQKDSLIDISIRAPFVGEAGRVIISPDSIIAVNKINKTYVNEGIADFLKYYPGDFSDLQDLLLARMFIPGHNLMDEDVDELIELVYEDGQLNVIPKDKAKIEGIIYGYIVDENFNPLTLLIVPENRQDIEIDIFFYQKLQGYDIQLVFNENNINKDLTLEFKPPKWEGEMPKELSLNNKFRRLSLGEFLKSF